jgi:hypothetical protein
MSNITLSAPVASTLTVTFSDVEGTKVTETKVIDLTTNYTVVRAPRNATVHEGVWPWALLNAPHTVTLKAKQRIFDNLVNQRSPFSGVGRIPNAALAAFREANRVTFADLDL